ncbi:MAG: sugar phosphate isomerase/epimerase family protein [Planctomycetota bacterium]|jgi:sugar phosphate isomerase/epimerase|nr:sugar phosphate isomerase/epimerase family protein [Planctomycetota bacterium]MDP7129370.1 sugar phosphate isomerase/epimerase family protein [Planctomycetota bacterium]MDP7248691.1 sugar phosphate isomerase/epimerase family protein [Planctomycetota bacterium]
MKFAICNETYEGWSFEDQLASAAELGYDGMEVAPFTLAKGAFDIDADRRKELREQADAKGIHLTGLHWLMLGPDGLYLTSPDEKTRKFTIDYLHELIRLCADIGGKTLVFGSPAQRNLLEGVSFDQAWEYAKTAFGSAADVAGEKDVYLLMESLPAPECNFIQTLDDAMKMVDEVGHPNFQMMVDVKSMSAEGKPLDEMILGVGDKLKYVHANDANRRGPGFGDTDFRPVLGALAQMGYEGYVSVEVFDYSPDPVTIARESLNHLKTVLNEIQGSN